MKVGEPVNPEWLEAQWQAWVVAQARAAGWRVHVNLRRKSTRSSKIQDPSWPDLEMYHPGKGRFLWVELKARGKKPTPEQAEVLAGIHAATVDMVGAAVAVWTPEHAATVLEVLHGA